MININEHSSNLNIKYIKTLLGTHSKYFIQDRKQLASISHKNDSTMKRILSGTHWGITFYDIDPTYSPTEMKGYPFCSFEFNTLFPDFPNYKKFKSDLRNLFNSMTSKSLFHTRYDVENITHERENIIFQVRIERDEDLPLIVELAKRVFNYMLLVEQGKGRKSSRKRV